MSIASRFWNDNPFTVQPKQHEEINVVVKPEENIRHDKDCEVDLAIETFDECIRLQTEANMYNSSFAGRFCDANVFGNCTIPQVRNSALFIYFPKLTKKFSNGNFNLIT